MASRKSKKQDPLLAAGIDLTTITAEERLEHWVNSGGAKSLEAELKQLREASTITPKMLTSIIK